MKYDKIVEEIKNRMQYLNTKSEEYKYKSYIVEGDKNIEYYQNKREECLQEIDKLDSLLQFRIK